MKITLICHDMPYPANLGARIDMWRRIKAFYNIGVEMQLISWYHVAPKPEEISELKKYVKELNLIPFKRTLGTLTQRTIDLFSYPLEVTSRILKGKELSDLVSHVSVFQPNLIWLDGIHGGEIATVLSKRLNVPLVTRSHNIEHLYYQRLLAQSPNLGSKFKRYLSVSHLENYEKSLLKNSALFYDISVDDLEFWQAQGFTNGRYLPPIFEFPVQKIETTNTNKNPGYDVVFLGNLSINNNIAGVSWFITKVFPILRAKLPDIKVLIAGFKPVKEIIKLCEEHQGIDLKINPVSSEEIYRSGRVLINPVLSGSGVSIKSIEMLSYGQPIVTTPQGIAGLPKEVKQYFHLTSDADSFAAAIIKLLSQPYNVTVDTNMLESLFGTQTIERIISEIKSLPMAYGA